MAPGKPARAIKVHVPRHNSSPVNSKLKAELLVQAKAQKVRVDIHELPSDPLAQAIESASEWNSLLTTARAERGPQWDIGTQLFHVDKFSALYYDSTTLRDAAKKQLEKENADDQQDQPGQQQQHQHSQIHTPHRDSHREYQNMHHSMGHDTPQQHHRGHAPPMGMGYSYSGGTPMRGPPPNSYGGPPGGGSPFNSPSGPFYNNGPQHHDGPPMRMGMGNMNMSPGGGMDFPSHGGGMAMGGGMGGMPGGMAMGGGGGMMSPGMPDMRRRVTRGNPEENFMMHN